MPGLTYEERQAILVLRKALRKKPEIAHELIKDLSKETAYDLLKQVSVELNNLLTMTRVFSEAAGKLAKQHDEIELPEEVK